jgi:lauroyl/myristoyl acyltransferase
MSQAADIAKWAFYVQLRKGLDPARPLPFDLLRPVGGPVGKVLQRVNRKGQQLMEDEFLRCGLEPRVADAWRVQLRVAAEELVLAKHTKESLNHFVQFEGIHHLDRALERGKGVVWVYPHAGAVMLMLTWLVKNGYPYTQYAARGLAPKEVAEAHPELLGHNKWRAEVRQAREDDEDLTGASFLSLSKPTRELYRVLGRNELVGIAFDGRIGNKWKDYRFLGRRALLNPGAFRLAASTGAMLVPCYNVVPADGPARCIVGEAIDPSRSDAPEAVVHLIEEQIRRSPAEYGSWLLHCRVRNNIDDHPLFLDHAVDEKWRKWAEP